MKRNITIIVLFLFVSLLFSCKTSKNITTAENIVKSTENTKVENTKETETKSAITNIIDSSRTDENISVNIEVIEFFDHKGVIQDTTFNYGDTTIIVKSSGNVKSITKVSINKNSTTQNNIKTDTEENTDKIKEIDVLETSKTTENITSTTVFEKESKFHIPASITIIFIVIALIVILFIFWYFKVRK